MYKNDIFTSLVSIGQISGKFAAVVLFVANNISSNSKSVSIFFCKKKKNYFKKKKILVLSLKVQALQTTLCNKNGKE